MKKTGIARRIIALAVSLALVFTAAVVGSMATVNAGDFYARLALPAWAPPAWLFGPVWGVLYLAIAFSAWLAWRARGLRGSGPAFPLFFAQLAFNALWSWLFFAWRQGSLAFAGIVILWLLILATADAFRRLDRGAALLLLPYLAWVTFAAVLNFVTWRANPALLG